MPKNVLQENIYQPFSVAFSEMLSELISDTLWNFYPIMASSLKVQSRPIETWLGHWREAGRVFLVQA